MNARFEIIEVESGEVTIECEALAGLITIEPDGTWIDGFEFAEALERDGYDLAEWALRVATVGAEEVFSIRLGLDERFEGLAGSITAEELRQLLSLQEALTPQDESGAAEALEAIQEARLDGDEVCGWRAVLTDWAAGEYQTTTLTEAALATLSFFGWVVVEERASSIIVADESGWWLTTHAELNGAALSRDERDNISSEEMWWAFDEWCNRWECTFYTGEE